jgi:rhodanese-related sulfurtransferase
MVKDLSPQEFLALRAAGTPMTLLDVREDWEVQLAPVPAELVHIPMGQIVDRLSELDPTKETVVICRSGGRSMEVARFLTTQGFASVANVTGGILRWSRELDPKIPQY